MTAASKQSPNQPPASAVLAFPLNSGPVTESAPSSMVSSVSAVNTGGTTNPGMLSEFNTMVSAMFWENP